MYMFFNDFSSFLFGFYFDFCSFCFLKREKELGGWRDGEDLGGDEGGKTIIRIHCIKNLRVRTTLDMLCFLKEVTAEPERT